MLIFGEQLFCSRDSLMRLISCPTTPVWAGRGAVLKGQYLEESDMMAQIPSLTGHLSSPPHLLGGFISYCSATTRILECSSKASSQRDGTAIVARWNRSQSAIGISETTDQSDRPLMLGHHAKRPASPAEA